MLEVNTIVVVTVWVSVTEDVGTERQEHAEDTSGAARRSSAVGILIALPARLTTVGAVLSVVVDVTVVVVVVLFHSVS